MEKLILGFDLCDDVTKISRYRLDNMNPADSDERRVRTDGL